MEEKVDTLTKNWSDEKAVFENKLKEQSLQHEAALRCLQEDLQREKDEMVIVVPVGLFLFSFMNFL